MRYIAGMFHLLRTMRFCALVTAVSSASPAFADEPYEGRLFDAHVHYSHQVWDEIDAASALGLMYKAGVTGALTSSTPDEGTQRLVREKHPRVHIVPFYRPYKGDVDRASWFKRPERLVGAEAALEAGEHRGFGEVHIHAPVNIDDGRVQGLIRRVADAGLFIHPHAHSDVITRIFEIAPNSRIVWAHAGFTDPPEVIGRMMDEHQNLWADLSYREFGTMHVEGIIDVGGVNSEWEDLLIRHADRFMIGSDTWDISRWRGLQGIIDENRMWLGFLPRDVADKIAHQNGERLFGQPK